MVSDILSTEHASTRNKRVLIILKEMGKVERRGGNAVR